MPVEPPRAVKNLRNRINSPSPLRLARHILSQTNQDPRTPVIFLVVSLMVNVVIFGLLALALLGRGITMRDAYGPDTAARRSLACVYAAIALLSFGALLSAAVTSQITILVQLAIVLLPLQTLFIILTRWSLGPGNAVANANLAIAALHMVALLVYWF